MSSDLVKINTERELLSSFTRDYSSKLAEVQASAAAVLQDIASAVETENNETLALSKLQKQISDITLANDLTIVKAIDADISSKMSAFSALVESNNALGTEVFKVLGDSQAAIKDINDTIAKLNDNISSIRLTLKGY
jgi:phage-related minor tail protein